MADQEVNTQWVRDARGRFAQVTAFDLFPAGSLPAFRGDECSVVPLVEHPIDGDGNCFYLALAHVLPRPLFANRPHHQATPVEAQRAVRQELSNFLDGWATGRMGWALDPMFTRIYPRRAAGQEEVVTPQEFARHMLEEGMDGHWGENFEASLFARRYHINVVIVVEMRQVNEEAIGGAEQQIGRHVLVYPVLEHGQANDFHLPGTLNNAYPTLVLRYNSTLYGTYQDIPNPATGAPQRLFITHNTVAHYDVVRSLQLAPPDIHQVVPGADTFVTESLRLERDRQERASHFSASGGRVRSASVQADEERDASTGPARRRRRGGQAKANPLQSDHIGDSSFVYSYAANVSKNHSHDFPPHKSFQPVTTERMVNDSNSFYRAVAYMVWGDQDRWQEARQMAAQHLLEQWQGEAPWTEDQRYTRLIRIDAEGRVVNHGVCNVDEYAADMLDEAHPGTDAEWHIVARTFVINIVAASKELVEGREELWFDRYPVQERGQPNELVDQLEPKRDTGVVLLDGTHFDVVTSYKVASPTGQARANAQLKRCIAQPPPPKATAVRERESTRAAAVAARERMEQERQRQYEIDRQRQQEQAARERSNLPRLDPPQGQRCHTRDSHRNAMAGCAGRDVNHAVEYYNVGGFTHRCPWGCGGLYLKSEHDKLAKPRDDGSVTDGLMAKCCRNGRTDDPKTGYQWVHAKGPACEQYTLSVHAQIEHHEREFDKQNQKDLRSVLPKDLIDSLQRGLPAGQTLGKVFMATKHWKGSRRHMQEAYADSMAMFDKLGSPQLFLTFTGNPNWPEIEAVLKKGQSYIHQPKAVTRIFWEKFEELKKDIVERQIFGPVKCFVYSVEHQKRGLPHVHMLITLDRDRLALTPEFVDNIIAAEIPAEPDAADTSAEAVQQREVRRLVAKHQMHTCSDYCLRDDGTCEKRFPREYSGETVISEGFTQYKRRAPDEGGQLIDMRARGHSQLLSNQYVVPYNPFLLLKYGSHHNLEWVGGYKKALEYTLKYLLKGGDMAYVQVTNLDGTPTGMTDYDEIKQMFKVCYRTAMEAEMRIQGKPVVKLSHTVHKLWVHSPSSANMIVEEGHEEEAEPAAEAAVEAGGRRTMLTAYFDRCAHPETDADIEREGYVAGPKANELKYEDFPQYYHFDRMARSWVRRKRLITEQFIARLGSVNPRNAELTAIRILLQKTEGPTCWNDLKTVRDANGDRHTFHPNDPERGYHEAAVARGLLENNTAWVRTLEEANRERMGCRAFRRFFASTLVHSIPPDRQALFDHFVDSLTPRRGNETREQQTERAYQHLEYIFRQWETTCRDNGLRGPVAYDERVVERDLERAFQTEPGTEYVADDPDAHRSRDWWRRSADRNRARFNAGQRAAFDRILESLTDPSARSLFRLKGEGGTGKTFLYNTLIAELRARGEEVIVTGTTGVAATLLLTGRTAHSAFRIPIDVDSSDAPRISGQEQLAQRLRRARVIIIDEMTMMNKDVLNYIDRTLRSLYTGPEKELPYAGKAVCISGDWKQRLPIKKGERRQAIVQSTIKYSNTYHLFETLTLTENMRIDPAEREYQEWTRLVGNGLNFTEEGGELIEIDEANLVRDARELVDFVFPEHAITDPLRFVDDVADSAVLCYTNDHVDRLNAELLSRIAGEEYVLRSIDKPLNVANNNPLDIHNADLNLELIHAKTPGNIPPHELRLKKGCICLLTKNLDLESGLCNGTRLQFLDVRLADGAGAMADQLMPVVTCRVLNGKSKGKLITLIPSRFQHGLERNSRETPFERLQVPIKLAFVMTADKAQGQTLNRVGLYLADKEAFAHGHVYVPITRIKQRNCLKILPHRTGEQRNLVKNVVWPEVLDVEDRLPVVHDNPQPPPPPPSSQTRRAETDPGGAPSSTPPAHPHGADTTPHQRAPDTTDRLAALRAEALSNAFQRDVRRAFAEGRTDEASIERIADEHVERALRTRQQGLMTYSERLLEREATATGELQDVKRKKSFIKRVGSALFGKSKKEQKRAEPKREPTWAEAFLKDPSLRASIDLVGEDNIRRGKSLDYSIRPDSSTIMSLEGRANIIRMFMDDEPMEVSTPPHADDDPPPSAELCKETPTKTASYRQASETVVPSRISSVQSPFRQHHDSDSEEEPENPNKDRLKSSPDEGKTVTLSSDPFVAEMEKLVLKGYWAAKAEEEQQQAIADAEEELELERLVKRLEESKAARIAAEQRADAEMKEAVKLEALRQLLDEEKAKLEVDQRDAIAAERALEELKRRAWERYESDSDDDLLPV